MNFLAELLAEESRAPLTGFKYGLLLLPVEETGSTIDRLDATTVTYPARIAELMDKSAVAGWRDFFGTLMWREVETGRHRAVVARIPSERAEIVDQENGKLIERLFLPWRARLLAGGSPPFSGTAWRLSGQAADGNDRGQLLDPRQVGPLDPLRRPFYASRGLYWERLVAREVPVGEWLEVERQLQQDIPDLIAVGLKSFENGYEQQDISFRIPGFVRAAEAVLAIPARAKGGGTEVFAERAIRVAPNLVIDPQLAGQDIPERLKQLYRHRNDCVHGKVPFELLQASGERGQDEAAMFEYLAESVARAALRLAVGERSKYLEFQTRARLEAAWQAGTFPELRPTSDGGPTSTVAATRADGIAR